MLTLVLEVPDSNNNGAIAMAEAINIANRQGRREIRFFNSDGHVLQSNPGQWQIGSGHLGGEKAAWSRLESDCLRLHPVEVESCDGDSAAAGRRDQGLACVESAAEVEVVWIEGGDALGAVRNHGSHGLQSYVADLDEVVLEAGGCDVVAALRLDCGEVDVA